jgi:TPR repeat protein
MKVLLRISTLASLLFGSLLTPCWADVTAGRAAYERHDYQAALQALRPSADGGDASAQFLLGSMYAHGEGVTQDYAHAAQWFLRAAEQGHPAAQFNVGILYDEGLGVKQDYTEATRWFRQAAHQGSAAAQLNLGSAV